MCIFATKVHSHKPFMLFYIADTDFTVDLVVALREGYPECFLHFFRKNQLFQYNIFIIIFRLPVII